MKKAGKKVQKRCKYCNEPIRRWKVYCNLACRNKGYIGQKHSKAHCKAISEGLKKNKYKRKNLFKKGKEHPYWNEDRTDQRERLTGYYRDWRYAVIKRDKWTCQLCGSTRSSGKKLVVDHIKPFAIYKKLRFEVDNGRVLCDECHRTTATYCRKYCDVIRKRYENYISKEK